MKKNLVFCFFLVVGLAMFRDDVWRCKIFCLQVLSVLALAGVVWRRVHWSAALALASSLFSCLYVFDGPLRPYRHMAGVAQLSLEAQAMESMIFIVLVTVPFLFMDRRARDALRTAIAWFGFLDSTYVIAQWINGNDFVHRGAFMGNASMNACVIATAYAFFDTDLLWRPIGRALEWRVRFAQRCALKAVLEQALIWLPILAILLSHSTAGILTLAVVFAAHLFASVRFKTAVVAVVLSWAILIGIGCFLTRAGQPFIHDGDRFGIWAAAMQYWRVNASWLFGAGQGTFFLLMPSIQQHIGLHLGHFWLWAHQDYPVQILFEQGIVGLLAFTALFVAVCARSLRTDRTWLFAAACGFMAMSTGNYPCRLAPTSLIMAGIVSIAFAKDNEA